MLGQKLAALIHACSRLCVILALVAMLTWAVGLAVSDRFLWSQFPAYVPTAIYAAIAAVLLAVAGLLSRVPRRSASRTRPPRLLRVATLLLAVQVGYFALIECRVYRFIGRDTLQAAALRPGGLRILYWNPSSVSGADLRTTMNMVPSDLAITANPTWERPFSEMAAVYGPSWYINSGRFVVLSRSPVLRWGITSLGLTGHEQVAFGPGEFEMLPRGGLDTGCAMWMEIDTRAVLGRPIIVWLLDLPSDERSGRWRNAGLAAAAMRDWPGPACIPDGHGGVVRTEPITGFPTPDIVLGDLNTPPGSASLSRLAPGMADVFDQGGAGYAATFPRQHPVVHIDQMLAAPWLKGADYRVIDPGRAHHRMQWARLEAR